MTRIAVSNPVVEMLGDEMAAVIWVEIRERLILPFVALPLERYDLSIMNRNRTNDAVTTAAAHATARHRTAVKCATITPDQERVCTLGLKQAWKSCNGTIRRIVGGDVFREPIVLANIPPLVRRWKRPIIIGWHGFGDLYRATELDIAVPGRLALTFTPADGEARSEERKNELVYDFEGPGMALAIFNSDASITEFARACFRCACQRGYPLFLSTKNTVLKVYDARFKSIFERVFDSEFSEEFRARGLVYEHKLIDEMVAIALKSDGGFVWACKNYDGDVQSDFVAQGFGSLGLMVSAMITPDGETLMAEAGHGTASRHWRDHLANKPTSTNPLALVFAWTRALKHRAALDHNCGLAAFAEGLETACIRTVEKGRMTRDLADLIGPDQGWMTTSEMLDAIELELHETMRRERAQAGVRRANRTQNAEDVASGDMASGDVIP